jgi:4-amino-4-deoxy-L-arabinose transferase-like glycosyltransferase
VSRRELGWLFVVALGLRLAAMLALDTPGDAQGLTAWEWGGEAPTLAESLYQGRGYVDPWAQGTGPSAWLTPVYSFFLAGLMQLGGGVSSSTALLLFVAQSLASALTAVVLVSLGYQLGLPGAGRLAGWLFALYPIAIWNSVAVVWDTTFVALGVPAVLLLLVILGRESRCFLGVSGLVYGALLFLNPAPMAMVPAIVAWIALGTWRRGAVHAVLSCGVFVGCALAVCLPWMLRNQRVLGTLQIRPNFGVEMRLGNHDAAHGRPVPFEYHPSHVEEELALYRELGEAEYGRENMGRALAWIRAHPGRFAALSLRRLQVFWVGELPTSDPRRSERLTPGRDPGSWVKFLVYLLTGAGGLAGLLLAPLRRDDKILLCGALLLFCAPYVLTHVSERYRFPIDPLLVLTGSWLVLRVLGRTGHGPPIRGQTHR